MSAFKKDIEIECNFDPCYTNRNGRRYSAETLNKAIEEANRRIENGSMPIIVVGNDNMLENRKQVGTVDSLEITPDCTVKFKGTIDQIDTIDTLNILYTSASFTSKNPPSL